MVDIGVPLVENRSPRNFPNKHPCPIINCVEILTVGHKRAHRLNTGLRDPKPYTLKGLGWVLPPLSNSWIMTVIWLYIALNRTPNVDCYWVGAVPKA